MKLIAAWILADFISGLGHWAQDRLLNHESRFKFLNTIKRDNDLHHAKPGAMVQFSHWKNIDTSVVIALPVAGILYALGFDPIVFMAVLFASVANIVHRYAHVPVLKIPPLIRKLQVIGIFQSPHHHVGHHFDRKGLIKKENATIRYCVMTNWLNPILDRIRFWHFLELIFRREP